MIEGILKPRMVRAPEFGAGEWLNVEHPLTMAGLRGQAVLVDIWDYSCINCLRTLPYLRQWHARYVNKGLVTVGVHSPEFHFGRERQQIEAAVRELEISYPVLMDNRFQTWDAFATRAWYEKCSVLGDESGAPQGCQMAPNLPAARCDLLE